MRRALVVLALIVHAHASAELQPLPSGVSGPQLRVGFARPAGGYDVQTVPLETYVAGVLSGEAARDSQSAALEALAITARTFALANRGRHRADSFDLCDQTHCQVVRTATLATERAAAATAGRLLVRDRAPASVYYSASCGGRTEVPSAVWPGAEDPPFLPSRRDDACGGAPAWTADITASDLLRALRASGFRGDRIRDLRIASRNSSGRVARLRLEGLKPEEISGQNLRVVVGRTLGWQHIKSTAFELRPTSLGYRFSGRGYGHGVGLCVIGSVRLAAAGKSAPEILARYFPGLAIVNLGPMLAATAPSPRLTGPSTRPAPTAPAVPSAPEMFVSLPDGDEGERAFVADLASHARDELARTLGVPVPSRVTLRFHPTTDSYEAATGQAWFASGAIVNGELHLVPLSVLRDRGMLERTIRHGLVHAMTDEALGRRPLWVREGAATYFAFERKARALAPQRRPRCPDDAELRRPVSIGALGNAYARARACFTHQIESGKSWRDVR